MSIVNGINYDWASISIKLPGLDIQAQGIDYSDELEKELSYGMGMKPRGYGRGNYKAEGKLSLLLDDYNDLAAYCRKKGVGFYDLVIPKIVVSYARDGLPTRTDILNRVTFTKRSGSAKQGDKALTKELDFIIVGDIEEDGVAAIK